MASQVFPRAESPHLDFPDDEESQPLTGKFAKDALNESPIEQARDQTEALTLSRAYIAALHLAVVCLAFLSIRGPISTSIAVGEPVDGRSWSVAFNATLDELRMANESIDGDLVELDGGGYLASLGAYHELHCLRRLRHYLYREYYFRNLTQMEADNVHAHLDHCIEALRVTIMCHGNTEVYSFEWDDPKSYKPAAKSNGRSVCARWSSVEDWAYSRMTTYDDIVHPPSVA
ncbi:hypothetical protein INS49_013387 [Diaporthe citri]|uniref:uncharacterized protein n=1 Tax=Diaporthe citri TaxID=83186 RepID=UPI001C7FBDF7|nr:uncharacterized protein INS49_013387 [Diaporthe citri]KAG6357510.1 hypothetical protein INS49_013387 [Diaporthe citri]